MLEGIANTKNNIADVEEKISRLEEASNTLKVSISEAETLKSSVVGLEINSKKWAGEEYKDFGETYNVYEENVKKYVSRTEGAKREINDELKKYEAQLDTAIIGLNNLENTLDSLQQQIAQL